jgi:hypothetical protein
MPIYYVLIGDAAATKLTADLWRISRRSVSEAVRKNPQQEKTMRGIFNSESTGRFDTTKSPPKATRIPFLRREMGRLRKNFPRPRRAGSNSG